MTSAPRGLLHRLAARAEDDARMAVLDDMTIPNDVLDHVNMLLDSRVGSSLLSSTDGLPDTTDRVHDLPSSMPTLQRDVIAAIMRGEPRITRLTGLAPTRLRQQKVCLQLRADFLHGGSVCLSLTLERPTRWHVTRLDDGKVRKDEPCF